MEKREFFARTPILLRSAFSLLLNTAFFFGPLIARLTIPGAARFLDWLTCIGAALFGAYVLFRYLSIIIRRTINPVPVLTLDAEKLSTPVLRLAWPAVGAVRVKGFLAGSRLCISTVNDNALLSRMKPLAAVYYGIRISLLGAAIVLPPLRGITFAELCALIEEYRSAALSPAKGDVCPSTSSG